MSEEIQATPSKEAAPTPVAPVAEEQTPVAESAASVPAAEAPGKKAAPRAKAAKAPASGKSVTAKKTSPKPAAEATSAEPAKATKAARTKKPTVVKPKLVRDSFTLPESDYALFATLKQRAVAGGTEVKKSELVRAALAMLASADDAKFIKALGQVERIKTGRPKK